MIIESKKVVQVTFYEDGKQKIMSLLPGKRNYSKFHPETDPVLANQLYVFRKHGLISFDKLLPQDKEILKDIPEGPEKFKELARRVHLKPVTRRVPKTNTLEEQARRVLKEDNETPGRDDSEVPSTKLYRANSEQFGGIPE